MIAPSSLAETIRCESGLKTAEFNFAACPLSRICSCPLAASRITTTGCGRSDALANRSPSELKEIPLSQGLSTGISICRSHDSVRQRVAPPMRPASKYALSGLNITRFALTPCSRFGRAISCPEAAFQTITPSSPAPAIHLPSGLKATSKISS